MKIKQRKRYAFTLLEVLIVITIIAILSGIAFMNMGSLIPSSTLKQQTRQTANIIELAFSMAAIEGRELSITFDKEKREIALSYYFEEESDEEYFIEQLDQENPDEDITELKPLMVEKWDKSIELELIEIYTQDIDEDPREFMLFSPEGMCDGAKIVWREKSGLKQELELWPLIGKITIKPVDYNSPY